MTESRTMGHELQEEILNTVRKSQAAMVEAIQTWTSRPQIRLRTPSGTDLGLLPAQPPDYRRR